MLTIVEASITSGDVQALLQELNAALKRITGASGALSFAEDDVNDPRAAFVIAYESAACGCGALRPVSHDTAEIKRVYAHPNTKGVGTAIVQALETKARTFGYTRLVLETRKVNENAVAFYHKLGYTDCDNFGKYIGRNDAVCMEKAL